MVDLNTWTEKSREALARAFQKAEERSSAEVSLTDEAAMQLACFVQGPP